jgi:hypothetical protein
MDVNLERKRGSKKIIHHQRPKNSPEPQKTNNNIGTHRNIITVKQQHTLRSTHTVKTEKTKTKQKGNRKNITKQRRERSEISPPSFSSDPVDW